MIGEVDDTIVLVIVVPVDVLNVDIVVEVDTPAVVVVEEEDGLFMTA